MFFTVILRHTSSLAALGSIALTGGALAWAANVLSMVET